MGNIMKEFLPKVKYIRKQAKMSYRNIMRPIIIKHKKDYYDEINNHMIYDTMTLKCRKKKGPLVEMPVYCTDLKDMEKHKF